MNPFEVFSDFDRILCFRGDSWFWKAVHSNSGEILPFVNGCSRLSQLFIIASYCNGWGRQSSICTVYTATWKNSTAAVRLLFHWRRGDNFLHGRTRGCSFNRFLRLLFMLTPGYEPQPEFRNIYSYFEKGCQIKCACNNPERYVMWDMINALFLTL